MGSNIVQFNGLSSSARDSPCRYVSTEIRDFTADANQYRYHYGSSSRKESSDYEAQISSPLHSASSSGSWVPNDPPVQRLKRTYKFRTRKPGSHAESNVRKKRKKLSVQIMNETSSSSPINKLKQCCIRSKCMDLVDSRFLTEQRSKVLVMSQTERRFYLHRLYDMHSGKFFFDNVRVCTAFLVNAFGFSTCLQSSVKKTGTEEFSTTRSTISVGRSDSRDCIISFLQRVAQSTGDSMPDRHEYHLPYFQKIQVYEAFLEEHKKIHTTSPPSLSYFYRTWRSSVPEIKIRKVHRFTVCHECETIRAGLKSAGTDQRISAPLLSRKRLHDSFIAKERQEYTQKRDRAKLYPNEFVSLIVDGADQTSFGLPHFTFATKNTVGHAIKVKLIGVLDHGNVNHLSLFTLTDEFETGANHVVEAIHRTLQSKHLSVGTLPSCLFVQMDNCTRENKNRFLMAYLESLVGWGVFLEVQASFLPIGHTHADIDQSFSCTSRRLRNHDTVTLEDLVSELRRSYKPTPTVTEMRNIINFSGLCVNENYIRKVSGFTKYRYFKFNRASGIDVNVGKQVTYNTKCCVKTDCVEEWVPLLQSNTNAGFLLSLPDLRKTPPTSVTTPTNIGEVKKRLESEEARINDVSKMRKLRDLVSRIYDSREISFHWSLSECFELTSVTANCTVQDQDDSCFRDDNKMQLSCQDLEYSPNYFVAVRGANISEDMPFWIAQIRKVISNQRGRNEWLEVHWWELRTGNSVYTGTFYPSFIQTGRNNTRSAWVDVVPVESVYVTFPSLTSVNKIGTRVANKIRQCLAER